MSWKKSKLSTPIPEEISKVTGALGATASTVTPVLSTIVSALEVAKVFVKNTVDPAQALVTSVITEVEEYINDLFATGAYMLVVNPFKLNRNEQLKDIVNEEVELQLEEDNYFNKTKKLKKKYKIEAENTLVDTKRERLYKQIEEIEAQEDTKQEEFDKRWEFYQAQRENLGFDSLGIPVLTPKQVIDTVVSSFDDVNDIERPQFSSHAQVAAFGILITAPGVDQFKELLKLFLQVLEIPELQIVLLRATEISSSTATGKSYPPDWKSIRLNSIKEFKVVQDALLDVLNYLKGYQITADEVIEDLINIIERKITVLSDLIDKLQQITQSLKETTGLFVFTYDGLGGNEAIKSELLNTTLIDSPNSLPLYCSPNNYSAMVLFVGGGSTLQPVRNLKKLMVKE